MLLPFFPNQYYVLLNHFLQLPRFVILQWVIKAKKPRRLKKTHLFSSRMLMMPQT